MSDSQSPSTAALAGDAKAWPFLEAKALLKRLRNRLPEKGYVAFQTGYGPSGLPHIGTFAEVARTTMVRNAFSQLSGLPSKLIAFSDDFDGMRKVPENIPKPELMEKHLGKPLTSVPDPFDEHESFAHHNNNRLRAFLDEFGFDYEFRSSTEEYKSGRFDNPLLAVLQNYETIRELVLPTLGEERRLTYSPFLPLSPTTGRVLQVPIDEIDKEAGTVIFVDENEKRTEVSVTGGQCKLQWKVDWAMRWHAFAVDYEMSGKDLIDSVTMSSKICRVLGTPPPQSFIYELFLDEEGHKISKSLGNGLSVEEWLRYGPQESLSYFMYRQPRTAKRLYFQVIPRTIDGYLKDLEAFEGQETTARLTNPVWHIHNGEPPAGGLRVSYDLLLNLVSVCSRHKERSVLLGFLGRYFPGLESSGDPFLKKMVDHALNYFEDFIAPTLCCRAPNAVESEALHELYERLASLKQEATPEEIQQVFYEVGNSRFGKENLKGWFQALYEVLLGRQQGPRMGSFVAIYGIAETLELIERGLSGELADGAPT